jgi:hypothetical protein
LEFLVGWIDPGSCPSNYVDQKQQGNQDSVMTLVEMSETKGQVKPHQVPHAIDGTQRNEITRGTDPQFYPKKVQKRE